MPSLKDLKNRIGSVKSTQKITSAMKMVAAAKLKKAQDNAERSRPYATKMHEIVSSLTSGNQNQVKKFGERNKDKRNILLLVCSADRGLCGGFNGSIIKFTKRITKELSEKNNIKFIFVGKKAYQALKRDYENMIIDNFTDIANPNIDFQLSSSVRDKVLQLFLAEEVDECHLIYTEFKSAITQIVKSHKLLPVNNDDEETNNKACNYEYEPNEESVLNEIIPRNIAIQIHSGLLENLASEQGSRMTAMDNATRNANDMIDNLTLLYNRSRQALITSELIEIISGAEAV
jgi:F-type H+-transporting ATPase subunit gamma